MLIASPNSRRDRTIDDHRVPLAFVPQGKVRIATIRCEDAGRTSVLNQPGPAVDAREWEAFVRLVGGRLREKELLLCAGSLPPGAPTDGYAYLARCARHAGSRCVIDAAGEALAATLEAGEGLVVPSLSEAETVIQGPVPEAVDPADAPERAQEAVNELLRRGAPSAVVTAGAAGAAYAEQGPNGRRSWTPARDIGQCNPIGAGDAFAAGLGVRLEAGAPLDSAVEFAASVAAAHIEAQREQAPPRPIEGLAGSPEPASALTM